jgi:CysZ protein
MMTAFLRAIGQLRDPRILRLLGFSVLLGIASFAAVWLGIAFLLTHTSVTRIGWLETAIDLLGGLATLVLTWLLFPLVLSACVCLFLDSVAAAVEARHHPELPPAPGLPWWQSLAVSARFLVAVIVCNVLLLALLLVPPVYPVAYVLVNGALVGREYFELIALRRCSPGMTRQLRRRHLPELLLMGIVVTVMLTVPLLNLITPVIGTAAMVHRFEAWRRADGQPARGT